MLKALRIVMRKSKGDPMRQSTNARALTEQNLNAASCLWPKQLNEAQLDALKVITVAHRLSVAASDLQLLDGRWYVTHPGLLRIARRNHCAGIHVRPASELCDADGARWAFKAIVYKSPTCRGFVGYGSSEE